jgi:WD40 repeat protein
LLGLGLRLNASDSGWDPSSPEPLDSLGAFVATRAAGRRLGDYELLTEIARGGMGVVYQARQISLNRLVAVKVLLFGEFASDEFVRRFRLEAEAVARLQHPHIVGIHEFGEDGGQHYFSMDYVDGRSLAELVQDRPLPARRAAAYLQTIAETVQYAHERGVLHRDLKPSNVLLDSSDRPRLTDFGLAKLAQSQVGPTTTGQVLGSPGYMPPEQAGAHGQAISPASDVYSLGAILFHLLTGRPPFVAETLQDTLTQVLQAEPIAPRRLNPSIPRDLETICLRCLEKDPGRRYATAAELAGDLGRFLGGQPIRARAVRAPEKLWRWCRREPALALVALLLATAVPCSIALAVHFGRLRAQAVRLMANERLQRYAAAMNIALRDVEDGNKTQALELLKQQIPKAGEPDLRGFEWRYLWRQCLGGPVRSIPGSPQVVGTLRFSPDGRYLAAYSWDSVCWVWDLRGERKVFTLAGASAFGGFSADGQSVLVGGTNGLLYRCGLASGQVTTFSTNAAVLVTAAADGGTVVTRAPDGTLRVLDTSSMRPRFSPPQPVARYLDNGWAAPVAVSGDGRILAVVQPTLGLSRIGRGIRLWDTRSGSELPAIDARGQIRCLQFSAGGTMLAAGDSEGKVVLSNLAEGKAQTLAAFDLPVLALAFSPDDATLAMGSSAQQIKWWDVGTGREIPDSRLNHIGAVSALAFAPDGRSLASAGRGSPIWFWDRSGKELPWVSHELSSREWGNFAFSPDGRSMAAGCKGNVVRVWRVDDFSERALLRNASFVVAFTPDGQSLLTAGHDEVAQWWNLQTQTVTPIPRYPGGMSNRVTAVDLAADRRLAALGHRDGRLQLIEIDTGRQVAEWQGHRDEVRSVAFSPRGDRLVTGGRDRAVMIWEVGTQRLLRASSEHKGAVCAVAMSADSRLIASGCGAGTLKIWNELDLSRGSVASFTYHSDGLRTLAFSPDALTLASGGEDRALKLWSIAARQMLVSIKHESPLRSVLFSPDSNTLATITDEGALRIFRTIPAAQMPPAR